jgi:hypothetical protein
MLVLTPEDGQFRPKHLVVLKILKVTSVENTEKCFKTLTSRTKDGEESESESEIAMCDRMQMYNIRHTQRIVSVCLYSF